MVHIDQLQRQIWIPTKPLRIVSLVPSQTELLFHLGLENQIVGITAYCVHPKKKCRKVKKVGGTKDFSVEKITALAPDLIIANKEENEKTGIETLCTLFPVWISDIYTIEDAFEMMQKIGEITHTLPKALHLIQTIKESFLALSVPYQPPKALYLIWKEPFMCAASETFIDEMLNKCGFINVAQSLKRYPMLSKEDIQRWNPDVILLSSEPYPFRERHIAEMQTILPNAKIQIVDGEIFSWYGSRLQYAAEYFEEINKVFLSGK